MIYHVEHGAKGCPSRHIRCQLKSNGKAGFPGHHGGSNDAALGDGILGSDRLCEGFADEHQGLVVDFGELDVLNEVENVFDLLGIVRVLVVDAGHVRFRFDISETHRSAL